ncbi:tRNA (guanosine-2'-O-)-methyltransferase [Algoriphagus iocasae]|uniref:tRNA (guanosine(18)-2'-O)-methyltransferase n=1 Tax=Algoriphagus iocasae TaxID=1836499 RepID=A0A841MVR3_9BACT|nr:RNA methyltransferase [Algoriphagus iocasae]MBB6328156.1 tRNA (guanosine-2'-O-)-methyltransferase [Algoriphagus iocasae]
MEENPLNTVDQNLINYLGQYITQHKKSVMERVLSQRTRFFTVVLEDIFKPHNASAVLRTCDCFGIQDVHVIEKTKEYKVNPFVTRGASQWVDLYKYHNPDGSGVQDCFSTLKSKGYKIFATSPVDDSISISELNPNEKIALVFGNEHEGVSQEVIENADGLVHIPMHGFTESFNISVAASLFLHHLIQSAETENIPDFYLADEEKSVLKLQWYKSVVKNSDIHEKAFYQGLK